MHDSNPDNIINSQYKSSLSSAIASNTNGYFNITSSLKQKVNRDTYNYTGISKDYTLQIKSYYSSVENELVAATAPVTWHDFKSMKQESPRSYNPQTSQTSIDTTSASHTLIYCTTATDSNVSISTNSLGLSCEDEYTDKFIDSWKHNPIKGLCGSAAPSKIQCFDSASTAAIGSRYCIFDNAMMNFKKMRRSIKSDGSINRQWERGFLTCECGFDAEDNIGSLFQIYKHDIDGSDDAICDYVFNETVVAYSHDNINSFSHMYSDYMNVWSIIWLAGIGHITKDVTFLNIDGIAKGKVYDDQPNQYFKHYELEFRRIVKAIDFGSRSKVCFKKLIVQPRPQIPYVRDGWWADAPCSYAGPSVLFQRHNLRTRELYNVLSREHIKKQILFIVRTPHTVTSIDASHTYDPRFVENIHEVEEALVSTFHDDGFTVIVMDVNQLPFEQQVKLFSDSSVVIGMHGSMLAMSMYMPIGSTDCCALIEIQPLGELNNIKGYANMARRMGLYYNSLVISESNGQATQTLQTLPPSTAPNADLPSKGSVGSTVPTRDLIRTVKELMERMHSRPSCVIRTAATKK